MSADKKTYRQLNRSLEDCPKKGSMWRHYKTQAIYCVLGSAIDENTQEPMVIYRPQMEAIAFVRPLKEWNEPLAWNGKGYLRFERVEGRFKVRGLSLA